MNILYAYLAVMMLAIVVATACFWTMPGARIVSGRRRARLTYLSALVATVGLGAATYALSQTYPSLVAARHIPPHLLTLLPLVPVVMLLATLYILLHARALNRSTLFYRVRRDELAPIVTRVLKQQQIPFKHRLRTFKDEFSLAEGRIIVHGGSLASRLELPGRNTAAKAAIADAVIREVIAGSRCEQVNCAKAR